MTPVQPISAPAQSAQHVEAPYLRVGILLCPDFTLTPMASFTDALRLAADREDESRQIHFAWDFIPAGPAPLRASCGLELLATGRLDDPAEYGCLVVCGGLLRSLPEVLPEVHGYLRAAAARNIPIVGLCTGSLVLAEAGLLDRRRCATHFNVLGSFVERFPKTQPVSTENYVIDGNIITCPGSVVAIEVAAHLIARFSESGRARKALNYLLFKPEETRITLKAKPYAEALEAASKLTIEAVQVMEFRLDSPCSIAALAKSLNTSRQQLNRAFLQDLNSSPAAFWRKIRMLAAREQLLGHRRTVTEIAFDVGFCDAAHFCKTFKAYFGLPPQEYRRRGAGRVPSQGGAR
ncbi:MAG: GlxA family transcriptional regulator [Paenirhodobacter sp.]|uniref:GlxA family transcriptional regulator n=1 Tax=Paenirhodobacter sp. TaxID=1965326 RepID=UPI003D114E5C